MFQIATLGYASKMAVKQGRSDGGYMGIYIPPKSVQVDFLWGKNDVKMAIGHEC